MAYPASFRPEFRINARNFSLPLGAHTIVMGVVNVTPDSFSGDGVMASPMRACSSATTKKEELSVSTARAVALAQELVDAGADIIDIGGESTRPGSRRITTGEEEARIIPVISHLAKKIRVPISADTYKSHVAKAALDAGASIINNIKGVRSEKTLLRMVARYNAAIVLMHIQGTPRTMQKKIDSRRDLIKEISRSLRNSIENCLEMGIKSDKIILDPGIGFGKTVEENLRILNRLREFQSLGYPILIGTSRKSFIGVTLKREVPDRLLGTLATVTASIMNGAHIVRVHDVPAAVEAAKMTDAILREGTL